MTGDALLFEAEEHPHAAVVLRLALFGAQVKMTLVDHLDAVVAQPLVPAAGADALLDQPAQLVGERRAGEFLGRRPVLAHHALAAAAARAGRAGRIAGRLALALRRRLALLR